MAQLNRLPILDLKRSYSGIEDEIHAAIERVLSSQAFILGPEVLAFEEHVESYLGGDRVPLGGDRHLRAIGCASGSDALLLALMALDIAPGDEIVTTPYSFFATAACIARLRGVPVFADIAPDTFNIDPDAAAARFTPRTRAFLPVHLFGQTAPLEKILPLCRERNVAVVEDAAQSFGAWRDVGDGIKRAGAMCLNDGVTAIGCFSFFPTKNLGGFGDGGMVVTADGAIAQAVAKLRVHGAGAATPYFHDDVGLNSRLDALQAAVLSVKLRHLEEWNAERRVIADRYRIMFASIFGDEELIKQPAEAQGNFHIYHQYVVRVRGGRRDELMNKLEERGISTRVYYPLPLHLQPCFAGLGYKKGDFPEAERLSEEALALPIFPGITGDEQRCLVEAAAEILGI
ncbi:MAG: DegT/DnrJ/EryC1/StrS family aminotransferase [Synergistaceae bacterium]|jgi:dTDP-4-amino-4,6-dideoxygalactose transaminase|nr:DegT/DnrJ/EryC1/StrS family aminotransferase [Synergistaceae bacterium]